MKNLHEIDLKYLRIFAAVVEHGGFTAAEEVLGIGCSSISKAIAELEGRLGVTLCRRGRSGFELTGQGEKLYQASNRLFAAVGQYVDEVGQLDKAVQPVLRMAMVDNTTPDPCCPLVEGLRRLQQQVPDLLIDLQVMASNDITLALLKEELDVGITLAHHKVKGLAVTELYREAVAPYVSVKHQGLWQQDELTVAELDGLRLASYTHREPGALMVADERHQFYFCPQVEGVLILVLSGGHVGMLPRFYAHSWVASGEIKELPVPELCLDSPIVAMTKIRGANQDLVGQLIHLMLTVRGESQ